MSKTNKVLVIGLDGATFAVLQPLLEQGRLSSLATLMEKGCWGSLMSTVPPSTAPAWSSFITGKSPGWHGVVSFQIRDRSNYDVGGRRFVDARRFDETLWDILSAAGIRIGVVNVPLTYPPRPVNGFMITGMLTPPGAREFTYPPGLAASLGNYTIDLDYLREGERFRVTGFPPPRQLIADIRHMTGIRGQTCLRLMQEWEWDFLMVVFTGIDRVSHFFWEHLQGRRTPASEDSIGDEVQSYLSGLDTIIGRLVKQVGQSATIIVMSDHGFGPAPKWRLHLNIWLEKIGLLHLREGVRNFVNLEYLRIKMGRNRPLKALLQRFVPQQVQEAVEGATQEMRYDFIDWSRTLAYYVPLYFHVCGIEVNLRGRNREGVVSFGQEYEVLLEKIIAEAKRLMDHQNGARIVREVYRREELYNGPRTADFPDIILVLDPFYSGAGSLAGTRVIEPILRPTRSGDHRREGVFIAAGPWVRPRANLAGLRLLDVPPTLLYLLGVPIPPSFEGRVLEEIFQPEFLDAHPVVHSARPSSRDVPVDSSPGYTEKEERLLEGRLRGLGYLD